MAIASVVAVAAPSGGTAWAQADSYKQHMDNGVKLYEDKNYAAAIAEFQAAYEARANPNPLLNIALCDKQMFHYPQAIAALVKALATHGDAMTADDKKALDLACSAKYPLDPRTFFRWRAWWRGRL